MKVQKMLIIFMFVTVSIHGQQSKPDPNIQLPIDEKIALYFEAFGDGRYTQGAGRFADAIVFEFQLEVIPYLEKYVREADYFGYKSEPKDVRLGLAAYIIFYLHTYSDPVFDDIVEPYDLDREIVQCFVDQYKLKLEKYVMEEKIIDRVAVTGEGHILSVAGYHMNWEQGVWVGGNEIEQYGHPDFVEDRQLNIHEIQAYYEQRLGIENLEFDLPEHYFVED